MTLAAIALALVASACEAGQTETTDAFGTVYEVPCEPTYTNPQGVVYWTATAYIDGLDPAKANVAVNVCGYEGYPAQPYDAQPWTAETCSTGGGVVSPGTVWQLCGTSQTVHADVMRVRVFE